MKEKKRVDESDGAKKQRPQPERKPPERAGERGTPSNTNVPKQPKQKGTPNH
ncbi:MAG: hypothetical protein M3458_00265 [Acidobacteriota bacterium]|nr:hypothetical protein [Acidobacteriota bacterium]